MNKLRYYFTFNDLHDDESLTTYALFTTWVLSEAEVFNVSFDQTFQSVYGLLQNQHLYDYITYTDYYILETYEDGFEEEADYSEFARKFYAVYLQTYERYLTLISFYTAQKANLLNQVESVTQTKFNDTPQNGGDWDDDEHLSTITTATTSSDVAPLIDRLNEIDKKYKDVISDWAREFDGLFLQQGYYDYE